MLIVDTPGWSASVERWRAFLDSMLEMRTRMGDPEELEEVERQIEIAKDWLQRKGFPVEG